MASILGRSDVGKVAAAPPPVQAAQPVIQATQPIVLKEEVTIAPAKAIAPVRSLNIAEDALEQFFGTPIPPGSNILILGSLGTGKSFFSRLFLAQGLRQAEKCMFVCVDDDPSMVRRELSTKYGLDLSNLEGQNQVRFVDAYSWSGGRTSSEEKFAITGTLELADLSGLISDAGAELEQTDRLKKGGRRVVDSISSLFLNFELAYVQRFIAFLARSGHFAGVSTVFIVEQGICSEQTLNNIKYIMDGVLEFKNEDERFLGRAQTVKWGIAKFEWIDATQA